MPRRHGVWVRGLVAAALTVGSVFSAKAAALTRTQYEGWDTTTGFFHMFLNIDLDPKTQAVIIDGGRMEFKVPGSWYTIEQASGAMVPTLGARQMAGVIFFSQANIGVSTTMFMGNLVGNLADGTLYAKSVSFQYMGRAYQVDFTMTVPGSPPPSTSMPSPTGINPTPVAPPTTTSSGGSSGGTLYLDTTNTRSVTQSSATKEPSFFSTTAFTVTQIWTYHWNNGRGEAPGTIELHGSNGVTYGPWKATGSTGSDNAQNVNWTVNLDLALPAGTYTVIDSSPATWSENAPYNVGFAKVTGHATTTAPASPAPTTSTPTPAKIVPTPVVTVPTKTITTTSSGGSTATKLYLDTSNTAGVTQSSSTKEPSFFSTTAFTVTQIWTYHWNNGRGAAPGTIALHSASGASYGPWQATGSAGQGNAPNVNWTVNLDLALPAGTYTVVDSSPSTWSENAPNNTGFAKVTGHP
jgi:hypothetical protein